MTGTNNAVNTPLSGVTGSSKFVGSTSPTLITPILGSATATSLAFSPTTGGIVGTTVADSAASGYVGEVISSTILAASAISLSNGVNANITSISLTAGDWDVYGNVYFICAGSTILLIAACTISTVSVTSNDSAYLFQTFPNPIAGNSTGIVAPTRRINISSTTTIYLVSGQTFSTSTLTGCGSIYARRMR